MIEYLFSFKVLISIAIIYLIYRFGTRKFNLHLKLGQKGPTPWPFLGNMVSISRTGINECDRQCREKFGLIYPSYFGTIGISIISDEELLKQILIKDFKCFTDRLSIGFETKSTEKMLTVLKGKDWERVRNLITPTFTSGKLKKMSPLLKACVDLLSKRLQSIPSDEPIDIKEFFGALSMDAIARTMFGMEIDSQSNPNNLFVANAKKVFELSNFNIVLWLVLAFPSFGRLLKKVKPDLEFFGGGVDFFMTNIQKAINERHNSTEIYNDFLALMLKAGLEDDEGNIESVVDDGDTKHLTHAEIMAQSFVFLVAGYETTATTLTYVAYHLAKNPQVQQQVYEELTEAIDANGEIKYETLMAMPLLDAAISETLRICPPAARFDRQCTKDIDLIASDNRIIHFKAGDVIAVPVYAIHTDPSIWPDPDTFDIRRFDPENRKGRSPYAYMPFGMGPRNCVGMRFALLEIKWALTSLLKDFEIMTCDQTIDKIKFKKIGLSQPEKPIILKVVKRH